MKATQMLRSLALGSIVLSLTLVAVAQDPDPVRALLLTGGHPYDVAEFHQMFNAMEGIHFTHVELQDHSEIFDDVTGWEFDAIVFFNMTHELSDARLENLVLLTKWGVGLVPLHHGTLSWTPQPYVRENIFGVQFPDAGSFGFHIGERFTYNIVDRDHPITIEMANFDVIDETYTNYYGKGQPGNRVLITTTHQPADPELVWVRRLNNSRIANIQGGHDRLMYENREFAELIRRSVLWTAGRLPAEVGGEALQGGSLFRNSDRMSAIIGVLMTRTADDSRQIETTIESLLMNDSLTGPQRSQLLRGLLEVASSTEASEPARSFALRQLGSHAEPGQLEGIAALLNDPEMNNMARYALEQIGHSRAAVLLREALAVTDGEIRRGIVFSLSRMGDEESREAIAELLKGPNVDDIRAAAAAIGTLGGSESVEVLRRAHLSSVGDHKSLIESGLITAAETASDDLATGIFRDLRNSGSTSEIRAAAWRGSLQGSEGSAALLEESLKQDDPRVRDAVIRAIPGMDFDGLANVLLSEWDSFSIQERLGVLYGLEERSLADGLEVIHRALRDDDVDVRGSAIYVAGSIGDAETAKALIGMMADATADERELIADALSTLPDDSIDGLLLTAAPGSNAAVRAEIVTVLANRGATQQIDALLESFNDEERAVRRAAFDAIARIGSDREVGSLIAFIQASDSTPDRREASRALIALVVDSEEKDMHLKALMDAIVKGEGDSAGALLPVIAALGTDSARDELITLSRSDREALRLDAIRALSEWKDASPIGALMEIVKAGEGRESALSARGYLRLVSSDPTLHRHEKMAAASRIQPYLTEQGGKAQLVALASGIPLKESLDIIISYLDDPAVQREAVHGVVSLSTALSADFPEEVNAALRHVIESEHLSDELRAEAQKGLDSIEMYRDRILANWVFADDLGGWQALNHSRIEIVDGVLMIHCEGADPYLGVDVDIPEQPMVIQFRVRYTDPQAFQFFIHTSERPMTAPESVVSVVPEPSNGDWVEYELNLDPKGTLLEFRFDPALKPGLVELDYIRLLKR